MLQVVLALTEEGCQVLAAFGLLHKTLNGRIIVGAVHTIHTKLLLLRKTAP